MFLNAYGKINDNNSNDTDNANNNNDKSNDCNVTFDVRPVFAINEITGQINPKERARYRKIRAKVCTECIYANVYASLNKSSVSTIEVAQSHLVLASSAKNSPSTQIFRRWCIRVKIPPRNLPDPRDTELFLDAPLRRS